MSSGVDQLIAEFEELIRQGQPGRVREAISRVKASEVSRPYLASLANIARRVGRAELALRLLHPVIRPKAPLREPATSKEKAIYASALARIGAPQEAIQILENIVDDRTPDVLLFLSFAHIHQWNYSAAAVSLEQYVQCEEITDYESIIGKLNLAAAYQFTGKVKQKWILLSEILEATQKNNWVRLRSSALELAGQAAISSGDWEDAKRYLAEARMLVPATDGDLAIRKWDALLELKRSGPEPSVVERVRQIRVEARNGGRWEAVRDCDLNLATTTKDSALATHVYFGTRHASYRKFIEESCADWTRIPEQYVWQIGGPGANRAFDLLSREERGGGTELVSSKSMSRLLQILASDFYAPASLGSLFAQLYPGEYFDTAHSIARVRRVIERLRLWFEESRIPIAIEVESGLVRLLGSEPYDLVVFKDQATEASEKQSLQELARLRAVFPYKGFSVREAAQRLALSPKKVRALLQWAHSAEKVYCAGRGRATRYCFEK